MNTLQISNEALWTHPCWFCTITYVLLLNIFNMHMCATSSKAAYWSTSNLFWSGILNSFLYSNILHNSLCIIQFIEIQNSTYAVFTICDVTAGQTSILKITFHVTLTRINFWDCYVLLLLVAHKIHKINSNTLKQPCINP